MGNYVSILFSIINNASVNIFAFLMHYHLHSPLARSRLNSFWSFPIRVFPTWRGWKFESEVVASGYKHLIFKISSSKNFFAKKLLKRLAYFFP